MTTTSSLYELILNLLRDPEALEDFKDNPESYLASCGDFSSDDVKDVLELIRDREDSDSNSRDHGHTVHVAPPSDPPEPRDGESEHEAAVRYLNTYVTNNYVDDRDTIVDNSVNQDIDTGGGDFDQDIDIDANVASGDGAVSADDISGSEVVTGDGNVVGDDNLTGDDNVVGDGNQVVSGDDNTTSFGEGDANSLAVGDDLELGDGAGAAIGGDADVDNTDNSVNDSNNTVEDTSVNDSNNDESTLSIDDSFNDSSDNSDNSDNSEDNSQQLDDPAS